MQVSCPLPGNAELNGAPIPITGSCRNLLKRKRMWGRHFQPCAIFWLVALLPLTFLFPVQCLAQTAETYRKQALKFSNAKSWDQAIANYREALALEPNDV